MAAARVQIREEKTPKGLESAEGSRVKLGTVEIAIDRLTEEQVAYATDYSAGT